MRNVFVWLAGCGRRQCLPSPIFEFAGSVNSDIWEFSFFDAYLFRRQPLVGAFGGPKALDVVGERIEAHRPVGERDVPVGVLPGHSVLEPVLIVPLVIVLAGVGAA